MSNGGIKGKITQGRTRIKEAGGVRVDMVKLAARVAELEDEVQECRQLNLRLAELTDIVQELLLPLATRDEEKLAELMERYARQLG